MLEKTCLGSAFSEASQRSLHTFLSLGATSNEELAVEMTLWKVGASSSDGFIDFYSYFHVSAVQLGRQTGFSL